MKARRRMLRAGLLASLVLAACGAPAPSPVPVTVEVTVPVTVIVRETQLQPVVVTATPPPTVEVPKVMTVCMPQEPPTLYAFGSSALATVAVGEALTGGVIDSRTFEYQPVAVAKLP